MKDVLSRLSGLDGLRGLDPAVLRASAQHWQLVTLKPEKLLWKQGRPADSLGFVLAGELSVLVDGIVVSRIGAGEMIGDVATATPRAVRTSTLRADAPTEVALLPAAAQHGLRESDRPLMSALVRHALRLVAARTADAYRETTKFRVGALAQPARVPLGRISNLVYKWRRSGAPPPVAPLLEQHAPLKRAGEAAITAVAEHLTPVRMLADDIIAVSGEDDPRVLLVAEGSVNHLFPNANGRTATLVAQVGPSALIGPEALAGVGARATSTAAATPAWLLAMDAATFERLPEAVRLAWMESALASATTACRDAMRALCTAVHAFSTEHPKAMPSIVGMAPSTSMVALFDAWSDLSSVVVDLNKIAQVEARARNPGRRR
jgi:CRP-like cAMP-binding protein